MVHTYATYVYYVMQDVYHQLYETYLQIQEWALAWLTLWSWAPAMDF